jgi:hypothetical protein
LSGFCQENYNFSDSFAKMGVVEQIKEIEDEYAKTQKNKNTEYHLGRLKAKLAKLRRELLEPAKGGPKGHYSYPKIYINFLRLILQSNPQFPENSLQLFWQIAISSPHGNQTRGMNFLESKPQSFLSLIFAKNLKPH